MRERIKGKSLIARDEGDYAHGVTIKLYSEETNGAISIIEQPFEPGLLLPPHVHQNDVWLYILEGTMHARVGDEVVEATPGCWVLKPRLIPHTMWNAGPEPARLIEVYTPGGFELFFKDFGDRLRQGPVGLDELNRLGEPRHSILRRLDRRAQSGLQPARHRRIAHRSVRWRTTTSLRSPRFRHICRVCFNQRTRRCSRSRTPRRTTRSPRLRRSPPDA
jgi:quercetin dioxygenase-like cupin family protein